MKTKNSLLLMGSRFVGLAISFFTIPILISWVGYHEYGAVLYSFTLSPYVAFIDIGFMIGAQKYSVEALLHGDFATLEKIQRTQSGLALVTGFLGLLIYILIGLLYHYPGLDPNTSFWVFSLAGWTFLTTIYGQVFITAAVAYEKYYPLTIGSTVRDVTQCFIILFLAWKFRTAYALSLAYAIGGVISLFAFWLIIFLGKCKVSVKPSLDRETVKYVSAIGIRNIPNSIIGNLANRGDKVLLGAYDRTGNVFVNYSLATKPIEIAYDLLRSAIVAILPETTKALKTDPAHASSLMFKNGLTFWTLGCCVMIPASALGDLFLKTWLHGNAVPGGSFIMVMMGFYYASELHHLTLATLFNAKGSPHKLIVFAVFNAIVTVCLTVPAYKMAGLPGVVIMNVAIAAAQLPFRVLWVARELESPFPLRNYLVRALSVLAICTAIFLFGHFYLAHTWLAHFKFGFLPLGLFCLVLATAICFGSGLAPMPNIMQSRLEKIAGRFRRA